MKTHFLYVLLLISNSILSQETTIDSVKILQQLTLDNYGKTEVVKNFPKNFPNVLIERGQPIIYNKKNSNNFEYIGMPIGGIGAGQLYLGGDGQLWFWDIFGLNYKMGQLKGEEAYQFPYKRSEPNKYGALMPTKQGFAINIKKNGQWISKKLNRDGIENIQFLGQYPIGEVTYSDNELPVKISLEAFSPFVPLNLNDSTFPATILNFTIENTSITTVKAQLDGWLENMVMTSSKKKEEFTGKLINQTIKLPEGGYQINYTSKINKGKTLLDKITDYGSMSLTAVGDNVFSKEGTQTTSLKDDAPLVGTLTKSINLKPGEKTTVTFILTWNFPKTRAITFPTGKNKNKKRNTDLRTNYYATKFKNSEEISNHILNNLKQLTKATRLWRDTWYDSSLPFWFLDRTFLNTSILASTTSNLLEDNGDILFYGTEGGNQGEGTCTHVWGYVQAMGRLFPDLEKSLREKVDFLSVEEGGALTKDGVIRYRWKDADPIKALAVDGQSGIILRTYLTHQVSKNKAFLKSIYPNLKKAMQGLTKLRDSDHDGILTGPQHNTLDGVWFGKVTWLSLHYTTALRAMSLMAQEMGDDEYAKFCLETADKGRNYIENNLFNGEYFIHEGNPEKEASPGTYTGLEYSQLLGQSWAYQVGMGEVIDPHKTKSALESMWRYNFSTDVGPFRKVMKGGRWYAMPGEGGLIACTWPRGGREVLSKGSKRYADYNNECQNGYEYAATSLMMWHKMPYHSLAHIWYMHNNRYIGSKRNPWNEIEWGIHYSRSMASYGHFIAVSGFEYHGPKQYIAFSPKVTRHNFKSAFTASEGWGSFEQNINDNTQIERIKVKYGTLRLKTLVFDVKEDKQVKVVTITLGNKKIKRSHFSQNGNRVTININAGITINPDNALTVELK